MTFQSEEDAKRTIQQKVLVDRHELGILLLQSLRYALGRRSTAPGETADMIKTYWQNIEPQFRGFLLRDLREEIERHERSPGLGVLGDSCDERTWRDLLTWMLDEATPK